MTNNKFKSLINKYAIIIAIGYAINFIILVVIIRLIPFPSEVVSTIIGILNSSIWLFQLIVNIIVAIIISKELKRLNLKNNLIGVMTILFPLIGFTMFL